MYNEKVMEIFNNPQNVGQIKNASGIGEVGSPACGDIMKIYLKIEDDIVKDAKFETFGCATAIVSTSIATELIIGKTVEEALKVSNKDVLKVMGQIPNRKIHCSILAEEAIEAAVKDYYKKQERKLKKMQA